MASRLAARFVSRRMSSSGKVLSEEERAAENAFIKNASECPGDPNRPSEKTNIKATSESGVRKNKSKTLDLKAISKASCDQW